MHPKIILNRMLHNPFFVIGLIAASIIIIFTIIAPILSTYDPIKNSLSEKFKPPAYLTDGIDGHIFGTDNLGRDIWTRLFYGARTSFYISFFASAICIVVGTVLGMAAGYFGRAVDTVIMRACDVLVAFPTLIFGIVVLALYGSSVINLIFVIGFTSWMNICKVIRNNVRIAGKMDYINASRALGAKSGHIIFLQILPNVTTNIIILGSQKITYTILLQANFAFLGLGILPPAPSWGHMIASGRSFLTVYPWMAFVPGVALMIAAIAFNFLGDGLRDVLDPKRTVVK